MPDNLYDLFSGQGLDELPPDEEEHDGPTYTYNKVTEFRAAISSASINNLGQLTIKLAVPPTDKHLALAVTDVRGVLMVFSVYEPVRDQENNAGD